MAFTSKDILKALLDAEVTQADIGRHCNVCRQAIGGVINGERRTPRLRRAIAQAISRSYSEVWGEEDPDPLAGNAALLAMSSNKPANQSGAA